MSTFDVLAEIERGYPFDEVSYPGSRGAASPPKVRPTRGAAASSSSASLQASAPATPSTSSTGPTPPPTFVAYVSYHFGALKFTGSTQEEANEKARRYCCPNPVENVR